MYMLVPLVVHKARLAKAPVERRTRLKRVHAPE